jgi:hypothetical protein
MRIHPAVPFCAALLFSAALRVCAQTAAPTAPVSTAPAAKVQAIQTAYQDIDRDTALRVVSVAEHEFASDEAGKSGTLKGFFKGDSLYKITLSVGLSYGKVRENYYFRQGQLVYVYETEDDNGKPAPAFEGRYYFEGYKTLSILVKGKKKEGPDDVHHPLELYHNASYYSGILQKEARRRRT